MDWIWSLDEEHPNLEKKRLNWDWIGFMGFNVLSKTKFNAIKLLKLRKNIQKRTDNQGEKGDRKDERKNGRRAK